MFYVQEREKKKKERKKKAFPLPSSFQKNKNKIVAKLRRILTRVGVVCKEQKKKKHSQNHAVSFTGDRQRCKRHLFVNSVFKVQD